MQNDLPVGTHIDHDRYGEGIIVKINFISYDIYFAKGGKIEILKSSTDFKIIKQVESHTSSQTSDVNISTIEKLIAHTLDKYGMLQEVVPLGEKWIGGKMILQPADKSLQSKEIPIETFFHKIVMLRDRLRVLEQNINTNSKLSNEEKIDLQQYITRMYGSLTTFNVLFQNKEHHFVGSVNEKK